MKPTMEEMLQMKADLERRIDLLERAVEALLALHTADVRQDLRAPAGAPARASGTGARLMRWLALVLLLGCAEPVPLPAPADASPPEAAASSADAAPEAGITDAAGGPVLLGRYTTTFRFGGAHESRAHNLETIRQRLYGNWGPEPDGEISFNDSVGRRSRAHGFLPAPAIFMGEVGDDIGGGTCQASSTMFAAALTAGLDVVSRTAHSRPSKYIPKGLDATVSYPESCTGKDCDKLDLVIHNPYPWPVRIKVEIGSAADESEHAFTVSFYGQGSPPHVDIRWLGGKEDADWKKRFHKTGKIRTATYKKRVQEGAAGLAGVLQVTRTWDDGRLDIQRFTSNYKPVDEVWEVGLDWDMTHKPWEPLTVSADPAAPAAAVP
jgi:hypothetical protein